MPSALTNCSLLNQLPDVYNVFVAYNPKNNKIYVADIRSGIDTKIWVLDMALPVDITCPASIPITPDYEYSYVSNNFEFDNNGDLWSLSNYNGVTGECSMDKFDVNTGIVINTRLLKFPVGNFPTSITSGDLTILPNGRMFATLGSYPSRLYEIINYSSTTTNATATYLTTLPQNCFGIAYLNGQLEITGFNVSGCYYYDYDIADNILGNPKNFQDEQLPIDNTSITPSLGVTNQLLNVVKLNDNTADISYEVYVRNLGNVAVNNINVTDDLAAVYGAGNISNVTTAFLPGANEAGLALNPSYNGSTITDLLIAGQNLANQTSVNKDYFFKLHLGLRITNLNAAEVYFNSAIGTATIGNASALSFIHISDSSNNGNQTVVDPNNNGNAGEAGENIPTPFSFATLPVKFINISASMVDKTSSVVKWIVATPIVNADKFEVEYSIDERTWNKIGLVNISNTNQSNYQFLHTHITGGNLYYRIRQVDTDGSYVYSNIVLLRNTATGNGFIIFPTPANNYITVGASYKIAGKIKVTLFDAAGKQLFSAIMTSSTKEISVANLPNGPYFLKIDNDRMTTAQKVLIKHP